jgi:hypothetical protein
MKQSLFLLKNTLLFLLAGIVTNAQFKGGEIVKIKNVSSGKYVRPFNGSSDANAQLVLSAGNDEASKWKVFVQPGGFFMFQNVQSKLYFTVMGASREEYGFIGQVGSWRQSHGLWALQKTSNGYKMRNKNSSLMAAVEGGSKENNAKLIQWGDNGQPDITWQFETAGASNPGTTGKKVLFDVVLNYVAVSEATRNRIDNGDCRRTFGTVTTELWELNDDNEMVTRLQSYNNMPEAIYNQPNYNNPPTAGLSYYQDNISNNNNSQMGKVTYNIPESLLKNKKLMLVVKTNLGTRHKDNDFASYDALKMAEEIRNTYILDYRSSRSETIETITDLASTNQAMNLLNLVIPFSVFQRADDTHKIWVKFSCKRN